MMRKCYFGLKELHKQRHCAQNIRGTISAFFSFSRDRVWRARKEAKLLEAFDVRDGGPSMWDEGMSPHGALCQSTGQKVSFLRECRSGCVLGRHSSGEGPWSWVTLGKPRAWMRCCSRLERETPLWAMEDNVRKQEETQRNGCRDWGMTTFGRQRETLV